MTETEIIEAEIAWLKERLNEYPDIHSGTYHKQLQLLLSGKECIKK